MAQNSPHFLPSQTTKRYFAGIEFSDFKVKDGECDKCSGGGAGPIVIEGKCEANTGHSCEGVKTTKETNDCVKYCDSSAGRTKLLS